MARLRDFLLGAQQLQEGTRQLAAGVQGAGIANARTEYQNQAPSLIQQFRAEADPARQAEIAGQYQSLVSKAQMGRDDPFAEAFAKYLSPSKKPVGASPFNKDQILTVAPWVGEDQAVEIAKMEDPKLQQKAMDSLGVQSRSTSNLADRQKARSVNYAKDFNKILQDQEVKFDDATKGISTSLAQFKKNPNKSSLQQLAVSMARAGGDTGVLSNQDLNAYRLNTISQDLEGLAAYVTDSPEDAITPSVKKALVDMAEFGLQNSESRKKDRLESLAKNQFSVYGKELFKNGKKSDVLRSWETKTGLEFNQDKDGSLSVLKSKGKLSGSGASLMSAANKISDSATKQKFINYLTKNKDRQFTEDEANHILNQMKGK